jgi:hypothetical protein
MQKRGYQHGEKHHSAKLSADRVNAVVEMVHTMDRVPFTRLAKEWGVHPETVRKIARAERRRSDKTPDNVR